MLLILHKCRCVSAFVKSHARLRSRLRDLDFYIDGIAWSAA
jgi:hypothetical protein